MEDDKCKELPRLPFRLMDRTASPHALEKGNTPDAAGEPKLRRGHAVLVIESHPNVIEMQDFYDRDS